jgi:uncharacterized protein (UPF0303 family)
MMQEPSVEPHALRAELLRQEALLIFQRFDNGTAIDLGLQMLASAERQGLTLTIDITRCQQQLFHVALPGTAKDNDYWAARKREMVYRIGHSSWFAAVESRITGEDLMKDYGLDPALFSSSAGGFPIFVQNVGLAGTACASGLSEQEDHKFVIEEIAKFLGLTL